MNREGLGLLISREQGEVCISTEPMRDEIEGRKTYCLGDSPPRNVSLFDEGFRETVFVLTMSRSGGVEVREACTGSKQKRGDSENKGTDIEGRERKEHRPRSASELKVPLHSGGRRT